MDDPRDELERTRELLHVVMAQRGEPDAFRWLVDRYEQRLLYFIRRIVDDADRALDVLQEVWITVFRRMKALKAPEAFRVWLYRIARDKAIDHLRGDRRHKDAVGESIDDSTVEASDNSEGLERIENVELIHRLLEKLTPAHREIVTLRFLEQMALDDIAAVVGCSIGTVKSRLHYALKRLQEGIEERKHV
jgi:RNA polymerase sigma-70 factor (ECF subfamily)